MVTADRSDELEPLPPFRRGAGQAMLNDVRTSIRHLWWLAGVPAAFCWLLIAYLAAIEAIQAVQGGETEHSPFSVLLYLLVPALVLTCAALGLRRQNREHASRPPSQH